MPGQYVFIRTEQARRGSVMNGLHLIQYPKEASYPVTGTPLVAFR